MEGFRGAQKGTEGHRKKHILTSLSVYLSLRVSVCLSLCVSVCMYNVFYSFNHFWVHKRMTLIFINFNTKYKCALLLLLTMYWLHVCMCLWIYFQIYFLTDLYFKIQYEFSVLLKITLIFWYLLRVSQTSVLLVTPMALYLYYIKLWEFSDEHWRFRFFQETGCYCGDGYKRYGSATEADCAVPCPGNSDQTCGGSLRQSVYELDGSWKNGNGRLILNGSFFLYCLNLVFFFSVSQTLFFLN